MSKKHSKNTTMKKILFLFLQLSFTLAYSQDFVGTILDKETKEPVAFATIYFTDLQTGTATDINGIFKVEHFKQEILTLHITNVGYEPFDAKINIANEKTKTFYLNPSHLNIEEVVISAPTGKLQGESIVSVESKTLKELNQTAPITLAETISNIPGVEQNTTGAGIGKPVIRGLSGNRIVTYAQGIRIENQQWGDEHGLGVGETGIEKVEVIKGPASLLYGSDAMGGVLFFIDERYAKHNTIELKANTKFVSNSLGTINNVAFKIHKDKFKFNLFGDYASHSDYQLPSFTKIFNTRFDEKNVKASFGFNLKNWVSNIRYSYLQNNFGISEDDTTSHSTERKFVLPFQTIDNHNLSWENNFYIKKSRLTSVLGFTRNFRREFEDDRDNPALGMYLDTYTYNLKWYSKQYKKTIDFVLGSQGMIQNNKNNGEEILIPDAQTIDVGVFALSNIKYKKIEFQIGARFDNRNINTFTTQNITKFKGNFNGFTFSGGSVYKDKKIKIRANVSSAFRAPNSSELLSDGVHEGTSRYEKGNRVLANENATQADVSFDYQDEHFQFSINPFFNYIKNYIYLSPTNLVIDNTPVYNYLQKDAYLYGGEMGFHYHPHKVHWLHLESNISTVFAEDVAKNPLPLIPQTKINTTISAELPKKHKVNFTKIYLQYIYKFKQDRVGLFETATNDYHLLNIGADLEIKTKKQPLEISFGAKNLTNSNYIDHLSRFKEMNVPNPGINFYIALKFGAEFGI